jgi:hypothetical protein
MTPKRIQRKRTKGWRMPEGAVYVGRPTLLGNPFRPSLENGHWLVRDDNDMNYDAWDNSKGSALAKCVELYEADLTYWLGGRLSWDEDLRKAVENLRGKDLACWCPLEDEYGNRVPCHADVLLELANGDEA